MNNSLYNGRKAILLNKKIIIFDNIEDLEKRLLLNYDIYGNNSNKENYIIQVNKIINSLKNAKDENYLAIVKNKFIFRKLYNGKIEMYDGLVFDYFPSDN